MVTIDVFESSVGIIQSDSVSLLVSYSDKIASKGYVIPCEPEEQDDGTYKLYFHHTELKQITLEDVKDILKDVTKAGRNQIRDRNGRWAEMGLGKPAAVSGALTNIKEYWHTDKKGRVTNAKYGGKNQEFRLSLTTKFAEGPVLQVLMFNPSLGGHNKQDKTLVMAQTVARKNGFGTIHVINLYTVREQNSIRVPKIKDKGIIPMSLVANKKATHTLVAFGSSLQSGDKNQVKHTKKALKYLKSKTKLVALGTAKNGAPKHPVAYPTYNPSGKFEDFVVPV
jgi:hypothetical protein